MKTKDALWIIFLFSTLLFACDPDEPDSSGRVGISGNITTIAGSGPSGDYNGDGALAISAKMGWLTGVSVDQDNNIYITDGAANTVRRVGFPSGIINTIAGKFVGFNILDAAPAGDGVEATSARLNVPMAIASDKNGNVFIADAANGLIRKVSSSDKMIHTLAGNFNFEYPGDGLAGNTIGIWNPFGVALDAAGNIYYADSQNNAVRMINASDGKVTTIAGLGPDHAGYSGDNGVATSAKLNRPQGIAIAKNGNIYIGDDGNHVIRKISAGIIITIAGSGEEGYSGDGGSATSAKFISIKGVAVDSEGNVFVADAAANVIRKINADGIISTFAGTGEAGYTGDEGPAISARLGHPWGVATDQNDHVYIADSDNGVIRLIYK